MGEKNLGRVEFFWQIALMKWSLLLSIIQKWANRRTGQLSVGRLWTIAEANPGCQSWGNAGWTFPYHRDKATRQFVLDSRKITGNDESGMTDDKLLQSSTWQ